MTHFDMRGQHVTNQYNAERDIHFGMVQTHTEFTATLEQLSEQVVQARNAKLLNDEVATDVQYQLTKASQQSHKPEPDKRTLLEHLTIAKDLIENIATVGGLVSAIIEAIQVAQRIFS